MIVIPDVVLKCTKRLDWNENGQEKGRLRSYEPTSLGPRSHRCRWHGDCFSYHQRVLSTQKEVKAVQFVRFTVRSIYAIIRESVE